MGDPHASFGGDEDERGVGDGPDALHRPRTHDGTPSITRFGSRALAHRGCGTRSDVRAAGASLARARWIDAARRAARRWAHARGGRVDRERAPGVAPESEATAARARRWRHDVGRAARSLSSRACAQGDDGRERERGVALLQRRWRLLWATAPSTSFDWMRRHRGSNGHPCRGRTSSRTKAQGAL